MQTTPCSRRASLRLLRHPQFVFSLIVAMCSSLAVVAAETATISGTVSNAATRNLLEGVKVEAPRLGRSVLTDNTGRFVLGDSSAPLLLFGGGSGITPMMSLIKSALRSGTRRMRLFYANRDKASRFDTIAAPLAKHPAVRDCDVFNPDLERLLRAKPDLVVLPRTSNPLWAERCRGAGLKVLVLAPESATSALADIRLIGEALGQTPEAIARLTRPLEGIPAQPPRKLLIVWDGMMAGPDSYLGVVMRSAGFKSALPQGSWSKLDWEAVAQANPDLLLWVDSLQEDGPIQPSEKRKAEVSQVTVVKELKSVKGGLVFETTSGSQWLPGSGLLQVSPKLADLRDKLR